MDGFYTTDGIAAMGYYTASELPFYYSLFENSTLCANYFCSLLGPTWPNRFYLAAGTSGGITTNGVWGYGVFDYPIILDLLEEAGVTWKVYNIGLGQRPVRQHRQRVRVLEEVRARPAHARQQGLVPERRPQGSAAAGVVARPELRARGWDEHPPADVSVGMGIQEELITAAAGAHRPGTAPRTCSPTTSTAGTSTTSRRRRSTRTGWVSACRRGSSRRTRSRRRSVEPTGYEHTSTLKLIEALHGLPTLVVAESPVRRLDAGGLELPGKRRAGTAA